MISDGYNFDNSNDGNKLAKSLASVQLWDSSDVDGSPGQSKESNNSSQFNAIPVGVRGGCCFTDYFYSRGIQTYFWSKNEHDQNHSICTYINFEDIKSNFQNNFKTDGYSVRFVSSEKPVNNSNILLNGSVSAENNQIKNVADPTDPQDAVTKKYVDTYITNVNNSPWFVIQAQDSIAFEKKVVIGGVENENVPPFNRNWYRFWFLFTNHCADTLDGTQQCYPV